MTEILTKNISIIEQRWPEIAKRIKQASLATLSVTLEKNTLLVNDIQLTSNYDRIEEADIQIEHISLQSAQVFLYGVGLGDVQIQLLKRPAIESLSVCILNVDLLLHCLSAVDHRLWLEDPRVSLFTAEDVADVYLPFVALPTELIFADNESAKLRDRIVLELDHDFIMKHHLESNALALAEVEKNTAFIKKDASVEQLFNSITGRVYVAAAGPTLSTHLPRLLSEKNTFIIALDAAVKPLLNAGVIPNIVVSIDARSDQIFTGVDFNDNLAGVKLVYFPRLSTSLLQQWPGKRYCSYSEGDLYKKYRGLYPKACLFSGGSVIHPAVDLAIKMGAEEVVFLGADFGFPDNKTYATGQNVEYTKQFLSSSHWVLNGKGERITTMLNYRGYLRDLERFIEVTPNVRFINGSDKGAKISGTRLLTCTE